MHNTIGDVTSVNIRRETNLYRVVTEEALYKVLSILKIYQILGQSQHELTMGGNLFSTQSTRVHAGGLLN